MSPRSGHIDVTVTPTPPMLVGAGKAVAGVMKIEFCSASVHPDVLLTAMRGEWRNE